MSMFNMAVPPHMLGPFLLRSINWAQPDDPDKKYPLFGRIRYVWMNEDFTEVKLLLKDGPDSWSENKKAIEEQIRNHESFVSLEVLERDKVYIVATFKPLKSLSYDEKSEDTIKNFLEKVPYVDVIMVNEHGETSITKDPFELFDAAMKNLNEGGEMTQEMKNFGESLKQQLSSIENEQKMEDMTKEAGIDGFKADNVRILSVNRDGTIDDKTN